MPELKFAKQKDAYIRKTIVQANSYCLQIN